MSDPQPLTPVNLDHDEMLAAAKRNAEGHREREERLKRAYKPRHYEYEESGLPPKSITENWDER